MVGGYYMPIPFDIDVGWNEKDVTERFGGMAGFNERFTLLREIQPQKPYLLNILGIGGRSAQWSRVKYGSSSIDFQLLGGATVTFKFTANNVTCTVND